MFEHMLPALEYEESVVPFLGASPISVRDEAEETALAGGGPEMVISDSSAAVVVSQVQQAVPSDDGGMGQEASALSSGLPEDGFLTVLLDSSGGGRGCRPRLLPPLLPGRFRWRRRCFSKRAWGRWPRGSLLWGRLGRPAGLQRR